MRGVREEAGGGGKLISFFHACFFLLAFLDLNLEFLFFNG